MRPEILNPLFAEVDVLKGVGPQVAKLLKRLDLTRVVDVLYHLPTGAIERIKAPAASANLLGRNVILELTPFDDRESRSGRGPTRIFAGDAEGHTNRRMGELAREALERAPELPEWIEPGLAQRQVWGLWRASLALAHREPGAEEARKRLAYDEIFANQLALLLLRQSQRRRRTVALPGTGKLTKQLRLPYQLTGAQRRVIAEIDGDLAQSTPMLRLLQGDVGSGKTLVAL